MRIIISDNDLDVGNNDFLVREVKSCKGCFCCWTKNNYKCAINDDAEDIGNKMLSCDEIVIITKCINGCYSSKVKRVLERSISFVKPYFTIRENKIHHLMRSDRIVPCTIIVYNKLSSSDKETFEKLVHANNINFATWQIKIIYVNNFEEAKKYL